MSFYHLIMNTVIRCLGDISMLKVVERHQLHGNDVIVIRDISNREYVLSICEVVPKCPDYPEQLLRMDNNKNNK